MNQPTRDEIEELKRRVERLENQHTEPIKITRLEIDSGSMNKRLDVVEENTNILKIEMQGARADISIVKANQSNLKEYLTEQFKSIDNK
jgi:hypothetical protein